VRHMSTPLNFSSPIEGKGEKGGGGGRQSQTSCDPPTCFLLPFEGKGGGGASTPGTHVNDNRALLSEWRPAGEKKVKKNRETFRRHDEIIYPYSL